MPATAAEVTQRLKHGRVDRDETLRVGLANRVGVV